MPNKMITTLLKHSAIQGTCAAYRILFKYYDTLAEPFHPICDLYFRHPSYQDLKLCCNIQDLGGQMIYRYFPLLC